MGPELVLLLSGPVASGKSTLSRALAAHFRMGVFNTRDWLLAALRDRGVGRSALQAEGERFDVATEGKWIAYKLQEELSRSPETARVLLDSVRTASQIKWVREAFGSAVFHIHVNASVDVLAARYNARRRISEGELPTYDQVRESTTEYNIGSLGELADCSIDSSNRTDDSVFELARNAVQNRFPSMPA